MPRPKKSAKQPKEIHVKTDLTFDELIEGAFHDKHFLKKDKVVLPEEKTAGDSKALKTAGNAKAVRGKSKK